MSSKWTKVSDRLPGLDDFDRQSDIVLIVATSEEWGDIVYPAVLSEYGWIPLGTGGPMRLSDDETVTHWQPLPDAPNQERKAT